MLDELLPLLDVDLDALRWQADALCVEPAYANVEFFPSPKTRPDDARAVCARCLVRKECLDYALREDIEHGVWGGTSPQERRELSKQRSVGPELPAAA